jgi:hypothetical protein
MVEKLFQGLLALAQIAIAVVATDAVLGFYLDMAFLSGFLKSFAYAGAAVGTVDQVYWLISSRLPELSEMY